MLLSMILLLVWLYVGVVFQLYFFHIFDQWADIRLDVQVY